jgi:tetratricopeptide (TPR) repeat protein
MSTRRDDTLDPDALAALEEERDFLLRSLDDLDREHEAGDVDGDDYRTLRDDYTHRAAVVLRSIEQRQAARVAATTSTRRSRGRIVAGVAGVVLLGVLAGLGVARAAGERTSGESITGGVRPTVGQMLFRCQQLVTSGEVRDALVCYDEIIEEQPANVEAITYRAWALAAFAGLPELAWPYLDEAVTIDPDYPDARAFRAIILNWWCRPDEVLAELDAFDGSRPLAEMQALIEDAQLRERARELLEVRQGVPAVAGAPLPVPDSDPDTWDQCPVLAEAGVLERVDPEAAPDSD